MGRGDGMTFITLNSQDVKIAIKQEVAALFPGVQIYLEHVPAQNPAFPHFQILILQTSRGQAPKQQIRDGYDIHTYLATIKYRAFDGLGLPPRNLLAELDDVGYIMRSGIRSLKLNASHRIREIRTENEPDQGVPLLVCGWYGTIDLLVKIPHDPIPLQRSLRYTAALAALGADNVMRPTTGSRIEGSAPAPPDMD